MPLTWLVCVCALPLSFAAESNPFAALAGSIGTTDLASNPEAKVAEGRICFAAQINGQPVKLAFDTGASSTVLFRDSARRLGLNVREMPRARMTDDGGPSMGRAESCMLNTIAGAKRIRPDVFNCEAFIPGNCDGILSWNELKDSIVEIDMSRNSLKVLDALPSDIGKYTPRKLVQAAWMLGFECRNGAETVRVGIDTGSPDGVWLNPRRWQNWCGAHRDSCQTLDCFSTSDDGMIVSEVARAKDIALGGLQLDDVPMRSFTTSEARALDGCDAVLGTFALTRLTVIFDARKGVVYTRPADPGPMAYSYNNLGAVFLPARGRDSGMVATVAPHSAAYDAGLRSGDVLVKVGGNTLGSFQSDPVKVIRNQCRQQAGTKVMLTVKRNGEKIDAEATLREPVAN